jgi:hypothetical protein
MFFKLLMLKFETNVISAGDFLEPFSVKQHQTPVKGRKFAVGVKNWSNWFFQISPSDLNSRYLLITFTLKPFGSVNKLWIP